MKEKLLWNEQCMSSECEWHAVRFSSRWLHIIIAHANAPFSMVVLQIRFFCTMAVVRRHMCIYFHANYLNHKVSAPIASFYMYYTLNRFVLLVFLPQRELLSSLPSLWLLRYTMAKKSPGKVTSLVVLKAVWQEMLPGNQFMRYIKFQPWYWLKNFTSSFQPCNVAWTLIGKWICRHKASIRDVKIDTSCTRGNWNSHMVLWRVLFAV